ncbi:unnamed protein product [Adineta steineri]|uniref:Uncharacterized protein n=1 Tax=Adineta steineri TaxID=433720 RepID=A0A814X5L7_9BILA|nr:unnamed protein product [Adineta steineri]CAF1500455.1 unnamed protein product [Adineta steineri]
MAAVNNKTRCITCDKEKRTVRCEGCLQLFCYDHLTDHRQELNKQLDHIQLNRDVFRQTLNEQMNHPQVHLLVKQINTWELDSIKIIQQTASECRQLLIEHRNEHFNQIEVNLNKLTDELRDIRQENDFNEIDLQQFNEKLKTLAEELDKLSNFSFQHDSTPLIHKVSVVVASSEAISSSKNINNNTKWKHNGSTIAGGYGEGSQTNQLYWPYGIYVDDDEQMIYIADYGNDRVVKWKHGAYYGQVVAGGNGRGTRKDQLNLPTDVILDKKNDSFVICDYGNRRVVRWPRKHGKNQQTIISHVACSRLTMDNNGDLYVSDWEKNEVRRWTKGETTGTLVAGGNGKGEDLNQLNSPGYIYVDDNLSVYVSDSNNNRVMKWTKGAKEGVVVAGGHGEGNTLQQLSHPQGLIVDHLGNIYVADSGNDRIMRWSEGSREGSIVVGGNGQGKQPDQFNYPDGLSLDQLGNLYVVDWGNNRVQRFVLDID